MKRHPALYASLASALLIGLPLGGVGAQTGSRNEGMATETLKVGDPYNGPAIAFASTPEVVAIPGTRIYTIRNSDYDMYRSGGRWYYRYDGCWYQGASYKGPFKFVTAVPRGVRAVSTRYPQGWVTASRRNPTGARNASFSKARLKSRHPRRTTVYGN